jgi:hypothetical protein
MVGLRETTGTDDAWTMLGASVGRLMTVERKAATATSASLIMFYGL